MKFLFPTSVLSLLLFAVLQMAGASDTSVPVPPMPVPANASHVTATVLRYSGSSMTVKIHTSKPVGSNLESFAVPGAIYEAFSSARFDPVGKEIEATLELTGTTHEVRWAITNIR